MTFYDDDDDGDDITENKRGCSASIDLYLQCLSTRILFSIGQYSCAHIFEKGIEKT